MKLTFLIALIAVACSPTYIVTKDEFSEIPKGSTKVTASVHYSADSLFMVASRVLARNGCPVQSDRTAMQIIGGNKSVEGGTVMNCRVFIEPNGTGSTATFSGEWGLNADGQLMQQALTGTSTNSMNKISFGGTGTTKPDVAYQYLVKYAKEIPGSIISYAK